MEYVYYEKIFTDFNVFLQQNEHLLISFFTKFLTDPPPIFIKWFEECFFLFCFLKRLCSICINSLNVQYNSPVKTWLGDFFWTGFKLLPLFSYSTLVNLSILYWVNFGSFCFWKNRSSSSELLNLCLNCYLLHFHMLIFFIIVGSMVIFCFNPDIANWHYLLFFYYCLLFWSGIILLYYFIYLILSYFIHFEHIRFFFIDFLYFSIFYFSDFCSHHYFLPSSCLRVCLFFYLLAFCFLGEGIWL